MTPVKKTRRIIVSEKIFTSQDLRRIAAIFNKQSSLAEKSGHSASTEYEVQFEDQTTLETDSPELFTDESLTSTSRSVGIRMSFYNFALGRCLILSLKHGGNWGHQSSVQISAQEETWLSENFVALKEALEKVRPQVFWFRRHRPISLFLIALGIGALVDLASAMLAHFIGHSKVPAPAWLDALMQFLYALPKPLSYTLHWLRLWLMGLPWSYPLYFWIENA